jgi:hypothetical protein
LGEGVVSFLFLIIKEREVTMKLKITMIIMLILLVVIALPTVTIYRSSSDTIDIIVTGKERITTGSGKYIDSKFMVYTVGEPEAVEIDNILTIQVKEEAFQVTDSWSFLKFNSTDVYMKLKRNGRYKVKVAGWRVNFLSWYRNIISIEEVLDNPVKEEV